MGGRNEQINFRHNSNLSTSVIKTLPHISSSLNESRHEFTVKESKADQISKNESDSNADTCLLGNNFIVLSIANKTADVYPNDNS